MRSASSARQISRQHLRRLPNGLPGPLRYWPMPSTTGKYRAGTKSLTWTVAAEANEEYDPTIDPKAVGQKGGLPAAYLKRRHGLAEALAGLVPRVHRGQPDALELCGAD